MNPRPLLTAVLWCSTSLLAACFNTEANDAAQEARPNVILTSIDTLRADRLGTYGYERNTTPNIDEFAKQAVVFETAYAQSSWTLASHASMFTGLDPVANGVTTSKRGRLVDRHVTLAEILKDEGYTTAAWVGRGEYSFVGAARGLAQGFDKFEHAPHGQANPGQSETTANKPQTKQEKKSSLGEGEAEITSVLEWLSGQPKLPFFLFVHLDDVHSQPTGHPYDSPPPFRDRFCPGEIEGYTGCDASGKFCATKMLQRIRRGDIPAPSKDEAAKIECLYDGGVAFTDHQVGRLLRSLRELQLLDNSVLIVTADHGEAFLEHGDTLHFSVYEEVARVPLVIRFPGAVHAGRSAAIVELVDLVPTILAQTGSPVPAFMQGQNLLDVIASPSTLTRVNDTAFTMGTSDPPPLLWRHGPSKIIVRPKDRTEVEARYPAEELFDLSSDPGEQRNRVQEDAELGRQLRQGLERHQHESAATFKKLRHDPAGDDFEVPEDERELLKALGYIE